MGKDLNFDVLYRGDRLDHVIEGRWVFIQRLKHLGGGYWLGRTYADAFMLEIERPVSLAEGIDYINTAVKVEMVAGQFDDDQLGLPF